MFVDQINIYQTNQMIFRVALFISLIAIFYYYCQDGGTSNQHRESNDINMIEVPVETNPAMQYESIPEAALNFDSIYYFSAKHTESDLSSMFLSSPPRKY